MTYMIKRPRICIPLISSTKDALLDELDKVLSMRPDLIEWRADYFLALNDFDALLEVLHEGFKGLSTPMIFTIRSRAEGGHFDLDDLTRLKLIGEVVSTGLVQMVDIELDCSSQQDCDFDNRDLVFGFSEVINVAHTNNTEVILSNHDFDGTPEFSEIVANIKRAQKWNADYCKLAYFAKESEDMMALMSASQYGSGILGQKMIAVSMGEAGKLSRVICGEFGSEITYAKGVYESAPGQMTVIELMDAWSSAMIDQSV